MSHFMKDIVNEVLHRNKAQMPEPVQERAGHVAQQVQAQQPQQPQQPQQFQQVPTSGQPIPGIYRPNYQKQKQQDRLNATASPAEPEIRPAVVASHRLQSSGNFGEDQLSELQRLTLANVNATIFGK